ncbi:unnamed protein product [Rhizophagus irregularis]|nr:unnamed protein product [Rhizophagus irregularis]
MFLLRQGRSSRLLTLSRYKTGLKLFPHFRLRMQKKVIIVTCTFTFDTHKDAIYFFNGMKGKQFDEPKGSKVNYLIEIWDVLNEEAQDHESTKK